MKVNFKKLQTLIENAYAPYSHFHVASVVVWTDGSLSEGVNVENNSFGGTVCAERNAIAQGVASGNVKQNETHSSFTRWWYSHAILANW